MSTIATTRILHAPATLHAPSNLNATLHRDAWIWPLPRLESVAPCVLRPAQRPLLQGVEVGYASRSSSPGLVPVFAVQDGVVAYAGSGEDGPTLCIDHLGGWSTQYSALAHVLARPTDRFRRRRKERVRAGDVIGHARPSTLRIRFILSRLTDDGCDEQDPTALIPSWSTLPWFAESDPSGGRPLKRPAVSHAAGTITTPGEPVP